MTSAEGFPQLPGPAGSNPGAISPDLTGRHRAVPSGWPGRPPRSGGRVCGNGRRSLRGRRSGRAGAGQPVEDPVWPPRSCEVRTG